MKPLGGRAWMFPESTDDKNIFLSFRALPTGHRILIQQGNSCASLWCCRFNRYFFPSQCIFRFFILFPAGAGRFDALMRRPPAAARLLWKNGTAPSGKIGKIWFSDFPRFSRKKLILGFFELYFELFGAFFELPDPSWTNPA